MQERYLLTSQECELLLELESNQTIEKTANALCRDPSGISRILSKIAEKYPALEKRSGKWVLTETGKRLNSLTRDSIRLQAGLASQKSTFRIGTNREFSSRILAPRLPELSQMYSGKKLYFYAFEFGTEQALLDGKIDIGIDCERPFDPEIGYRLLLDEPLLAVCTKQFKSKYSGDLSKIPHLICERLHPDKIFLSHENRFNVVAHFNDIASARAACLSGFGWALLPGYAVTNELENGELVCLKDKPVGTSRYGVWWLRNRSLDKRVIDLACSWLKNLKL